MSRLAAGGGREKGPCLGWVEPDEDAAGAWRMGLVLRTL